MSPKIFITCFTLFLILINLFGLEACTANQQGIYEVDTPAANGNIGFTDTPKLTNTKRPNNTPKSTFTARPSETPRPTNTRRPTDTPEPTSMVFNFEEILVGVARPLLGLPCRISESKAMQQNLPTIIYEADERLCIYGFPLGETVNLNIFDPSGRLVDALRLPVEYESSLTYTYFPFQFMLDLPTGEWRVTAGTNTMYAETNIPFGVDGKPILSRYPLLSPPATSPADPRRMDDFLPGDTMVIQGMNLPQDTELPAGIYRSELAGIYTKYIPVHGEILYTAHDGTLKTSFILDDYSNVETYTIFLFLNYQQPNSDEGQLITTFELRSPLTDKWIIRNGQTALGSNMLSNTVMYPGHLTVSENGKYTFIYQTDGNLVLYRTEDWMPLWASGTMDTHPGVCVMQGDGNLVIYDHDGGPIWSTDTWHDPGSYLIVQNDGNVVIYRQDGSPLWATNTVQP
jgi:hypothetical protein